MPSPTEDLLGIILFLLAVIYTYHFRFDDMVVEVDDMYTSIYIVRKYIGMRCSYLSVWMENQVTGV